MCGRDELVRDARERDREALPVPAPRTSDARRLAPEELERIRNRHELGGVGRHVSIELEDRGRLLEHVAVLEKDLTWLRYEIGIEETVGDAYCAQLECIVAARWFRWGRRLFGFKPLRPIRPLPDFPRT